MQQEQQELPEILAHLVTMEIMVAGALEVMLAIRVILVILVTTEVVGLEGQQVIQELRAMMEIMEQEVMLALEVMEVQAELADQQEILEQLVTTEIMEQAVMPAIPAIPGPQEILVITGQRAKAGMVVLVADLEVVDLEQEMQTLARMGQMELQYLLHLTG